MSSSEADLSNSSPFSISRLFHANLDALCLARARPLSPLENSLLALIHGAGLIAVWRASSWPFNFLAAAGLVSLLLALVLLRARRLSLAWLAPWFAAYGVLGLRFILFRWLNGSLPGYYDYLPPDWTLPPLHLEAVALAALLYSLAILIAQLVERRARLISAAAVLLGVAAVAWAAVVYAGGRTHGVTGSDPYAYVQMGIDWA
ncbi:MAG: hypothetical protein ACM3JD_17350, partial [Rudaea sp.]